MRDLIGEALGAFWMGLKRMADPRTDEQTMPIMWARLVRTTDSSPST